MEPWAGASRAAVWLNRAQQSSGSTAIRCHCTALHCCGPVSDRIEGRDSVGEEPVEGAAEERCDEAAWPLTPCCGVGAEQQQSSNERRTISCGATTPPPQPSLPARFRLQSRCSAVLRCCSPVLRVKWVRPSGDAVAARSSLQCNAMGRGAVQRQRTASGLRGRREREQWSTAISQLVRRPRSSGCSRVVSIHCQHAVSSFDPVADRTAAVQCSAVAADGG